MCSFRPRLHRLVSIDVSGRVHGLQWVGGGGIVPAEHWHHELNDVDGNLEGGGCQGEQHAAEAAAHDVWVSGE